MNRKVFLILFFLGSVVYADFLDDVKKMIGTQYKDYFDPLAKEINVAMNGGLFHQGKPLGITGFDAGLKIPLKKINQDFSDKLKTLQIESPQIFGLPWLQLEKGLPAKIDLVARVGIPIQGVTMYGVGLRYGIFSSIIPGIPDISIMGVYSSLSHEMLIATTKSANIVASFGLPLIKPYIGLGIDSTEVKATDKAKQNTPMVSEEVKGESNVTRIELGINLNIIPLLYFNLGYGIVDSDNFYVLSAGLKF